MKKIVISAGHSNKDPGAVAPWSTEAQVVVELRNLVARGLMEKGHEVVTDGEGGTNNALGSAIKLIQKDVTLAIEFHCNAAANPSASGVESIALATSPKNKIICQMLSKAIADVLGEKVRGDAGFIDPSKSHRGKLGWCDAGGIIVETFFISNQKSYNMYISKKQEVVDAIVNVINEVVNV